MNTAPRPASTTKVARSPGILLLDGWKSTVKVRPHPLLLETTRPPRSKRSVVASSLCQRQLCRRKAPAQVLSGTRGILNPACFPPGAWSATHHRERVRREEPTGREPVKDRPPGVNFALSRNVQKVPDGAQRCSRFTAPVSTRKRATAGAASALACSFGCSSEGSTQNERGSRPEKVGSRSRRAMFSA